jgi:hypothetical protein
MKQSFFTVWRRLPDAGIRLWRSGDYGIGWMAFEGDAVLFAKDTPLSREIIDTDVSDLALV